MSVSMNAEASSGDSRSEGVHQRMAGLVDCGLAEAALPWPNGKYLVVRRLESIVVSCRPHHQETSK